jgi:hypothetical protein
MLMVQLRHSLTVVIVRLRRVLLSGYINTVFRISKSEVNLMSSIIRIYNARK